MYMKNITLKSNWLRRALLGMLSACGLLVFSAAMRCEAGDPSGGGANTWDFVFSGSGQTGIAFMNFSSDFTFSGYEVITGTKNAVNPSSGSDTGRGGEGDTGRNPGSGGADNGGPSTGNTNLLVVGFADFTGLWTTNVNGDVLASFERVFSDHTEPV